VHAALFYQKMHHTVVHDTIERVALFAAAAGADEDFAQAAASGALASGGMVSIKSSKTPESGKQSSSKQGGSGSKERDGGKDSSKKHKQKQQGGHPKKFKNK
jgi:hypothetical protein